MAEGVKQRSDGTILYVVKVIISPGNYELWDAREGSEFGYMAMVLEQIRDHQLW